MKRTIAGIIGGLMFLVRKATTDRHMNAEYDSCVLPRATYSPWKIAPCFQDVYRAVRGCTMVDEYRLWELWKLVKQVESLPGVVVEVGTFKGGSAAVIASSMRGGELYLFDTFAGVPAADCTERDLYRGGEHVSGSLLAFGRIPPTPDVATHVIPGVFPCSAPEITPKFMHIDVDTYYGTARSLQWAASRVVVGGVIVVDDYGFCTTRGVRAAVDEFEDDRFLRVHNLNGHAVLVKVRA